MPESLTVSIFETVYAVHFIQRVLVNTPLHNQTIYFPPRGIILPENLDGKSSVTFIFKYTEVPAIFKFIFRIVNVDIGQINEHRMLFHFVRKNDKSVGIITKAGNAAILFDCCCHPLRRRKAAEHRAIPVVEAAIRQRFRPCMCTNS